MFMHASSTRVKNIFLEAKSAMFTSLCDNIKYIIRIKKRLMNGMIVKGKWAVENKLKLQFSVVYMFSIAKKIKYPYNIMFSSKGIKITTFNIHVHVYIFLYIYYTV